MKTASAKSRYFNSAPEKEQAYASTYTKKSSKKTSKSKSQTYTVKRGDNLGAISQKYGVSVAQIKSWNKIKGNSIHPGQRITVGKTTIVAEPQVEEAVAATPVKKTETKITAKSKEVVADAKSDEAIADATTVASEVAAAAQENKAAIAANNRKQAREISNYEEARLYIVQKGDSLFSIAKKHPGVTVENLKNWNQINGNSIQPGMKLKIGETAIKMLTTKNIKQLGAALVALLLFASCNSDKAQKAESLGNLNEISIIVNDVMWNGQVGDSLRKKLAAPVEGLSQEEPLFTLNQYTKKPLTAM